MSLLTLSASSAVLSQAYRMECQGVGVSSRLKLTGDALLIVTGAEARYMSMLPILTISLWKVAYRLAVHSFE